ncbi:MAG: hypothetical protein VW687_10335 [Curvibacter sp.]
MATEGISSSPSVSPPPRNNAASRAQEFRAEQQRVQNEQAQREAQAAERQARQREPVVNTQGQTTGRIVNERA